MTALLNLFSSLSLTTVWGKLKIALLIGAVGFMLWQGWQMTSLQKDVTKLEFNQTTLQAQVTQMAVDYRALSDNFKISAKTSEQYNESVVALSGKSTELEKSFSVLEVKVAKAPQKANTALPSQRGTTTGVSNETSSTAAPESLGGDVDSGSGGTDAEWRQLLDNTYCSAYPTDTKCQK